MFVYPEIDPVVVHIVGPLAIRWYGLTYLVGFAAAWFLAKRRAAQPGSPLTGTQVDDLIFFAALGVIVGGRMGSMLFYNFEQLLDNPLNLFRIWEGGMSFHGGLLGVIAALWLYARRQKLSFLKLTDFVAPLTPIGLGAGRIGNFINGELWGAPTSVPWAFIVNGEARHASQLYEALLEGLVLFIIVWVFSARPRPVMSVSAVFLIGYGVFRFAVEFVRLPDENLGYLAFGWLTMGQLLTLPMLLLGFFLLWRAYYGQSAGVVASR
jgi:phosphatidylglycerol:prolipoprotein diacylglycerol transferase